MYYTYLDGKLLYHPNIEELTIENTKLSVELNKTGSFRFAVRKENPMYTQIKKMKSIIKVYDDNDRLFRGRVLNTTRDFYNELQVTCEGELAFLLDSKLRPYSFQGSPEEYFTYLITEHNKQVDEDRQFKVGICTVTDPNDYITRSDSTYPDTLTTIQNKLIEPLGGYLWTREEVDGVYIDYLAGFNTINSQSIEFGENLLNFEETIKGQDIVTAIIPLGARLKDEEGNDTDERLDIKSVNNGVEYVHSVEAAEKYGWIYKVVTWDDVTLPQNLLTKAKEELQKNLNPTRSMELSAIDLHDLNADIQRFRIGRNTKVKSAPHNLDDLLLTRKLDIDLQNPANGLLVLGVEAQTFIEKQVNNQKVVGIITERIEIVEKNYELNTKKIDAVRNELYSEIEQTSEQISFSVSKKIESIEDEMTVNLRIDSSRGTVFKNNEVFTVLSVIIFRGSERITDMIALRRAMGNGVYLQWKWQRVDDDRFGIISADDEHIGNEGFTYTISADEVDTKVTFLCELKVDKED